jgi:hypothetical protein
MADGKHLSRAAERLPPVWEEACRQSITVRSKEKSKKAKKAREDSGLSGVITHDSPHSADSAEQKPIQLITGVLPNA